MPKRDEFHFAPTSSLNSAYFRDSAKFEKVRGIPSTGGTILPFNGDGRSELIVSVGDGFVYVLGK